MPADFSMGKTAPAAFASAILLQHSSATAPQQTLDALGRTPFGTPATDSIGSLRRCVKRDDSHSPQASTCTGH